MKFPGKFESSDVSRDNVSREIGRTEGVASCCLFVVVTMIEQCVAPPMWSLLSLLVLGVSYVSKKGGR